MMQEIVLDTSVLIKWFRQGEVLADQASAGGLSEWSDTDMATDAGSLRIG